MLWACCGECRDFSRGHTHGRGRPSLAVARGALCPLRELWGTPRRSPSPSPSRFQRCIAIPCDDSASNALGPRPEALSDDGGVDFAPVVKMSADEMAEGWPCLAECDEVTRHEFQLGCNVKRDDVVDFQRERAAARAAPRLLGEMALPDPRPPWRAGSGCVYVERAGGGERWECHDAGFIPSM